MSMHQIEDLVESSVRTLASAIPTPEDARDICFSLYELQNQFDCGYTVLRVPEELERLGYLRRLPPRRLPEPERGQALALAGENGFFEDSPGTYFYAKEGLACVTAGSPLWEKLCREGIIAGADVKPVRELPVLELAERMAGLAAAQPAGSVADLQGLWYALLPGFLMIEFDDEPDAQTHERLIALRDLLATPRHWRRPRNGVCCRPRTIWANAIPLRRSGWPPTPRGPANRAAAERNGK